MQKLRPTQMAVGMREVADKAARLRDFGSKDALRHLEGKPIPIVLGPRGHSYMVDHHHLARAAWETGLSHLPTSVVADLSALPSDEFWREMERRHWVHLYDQLGHGPHRPADLPENVRGLADDPYRSVAWQVRKLGGYDKTQVPFAEFAWAQFFRQRLKLHPVFHDFERAIEEALALATEPSAKDLPGYKGR